MRVYLDASVIVSLFIEDALSPRAERFLEETSPSVSVSDFAAAEFASAVNRRARMRMLSPTEAATALAMFDGWRLRGVVRLETRPIDVATADAYLRRLDLPLRTPDALNLAVADRAGLPLATFDLNMALCARVLGVGLVEL